MFKRITLFIITNILILTTVTLVMSTLGLNGYLPYLLVFSIVAGFSGAFISLMISRMVAKWMMKIQLIDPRSPQGDHEKFILEETYRLADKAQLKEMPEVGIYPSSEVNAFATGPSKKRSLVAVSSGMIDELDKDAISAIIGHEIAHIKNGDMVTMTLLQGIINAVVIFASRIVANVAANFVDERLSTIVYFVVAIACDILFSFLASPIVFWHSRKREFKADKLAGELAGVDKMIHALESLQTTITKVDTRQKSIAAFKISGKESFIALFSTHPPLEKRIEALKIKN